jgi:MoaA/NifB/PqqE/SkfB family radical SAM enzyme
MGPTGRSRIVQIHPTRRCNLRCLHCYSSSGPEVKETLDLDLLKDLLTDAAAQGYTVAGFSGGEPLLYKPLRKALEHAHGCGLITTVTSNGMLLDERRLEMLSGAADLLAISLDGVPESHDHMRADANAFSTMASRLEGVRRSGIPFGFIFTLTQHNLHELEWVAAFALEQGAHLLQIHPLEEAGRAAERLAGARPDGIETGYAFLLTTALQEQLGDRMRVQLDLASRQGMEASPGCFFADACPTEADLPLAELVSPLIVETDGSVVPLEYGLGRRFQLGNLHQARLEDLAGRWRRERLEDFRQLCRRTFEAVTTDPEAPLANWYEAVRQASVSVPVPPVPV